MDLYKKCGVDIDKAEGLVDKLKEKYPSIGGYAGSYEIDGVKLAATCDGVGTKLKLAFRLDSHGGVGVDLVAMSVNDLIAAGAKPLFFIDYFACGKLDEKVFMQVVEGISKGVKQAGCALLGGETAEMPGMYADGEYDLAGFAVGKIERELSFRSVQSGDAVIGYKSSGIHSNGFSLVRKIFSGEEIKKFGQALLEPTMIYSDLISPSPEIKNLAHVTGGGLNRALKRLLGEEKTADINIDELPGIYKEIEKKGVDFEQMKGVFNCGWGMLAVVDEDRASSLASSTGGKLIGKVK